MKFTRRFLVKKIPNFLGIFFLGKDLDPNWKSFFLIEALQMIPDHRRGVGQCYHSRCFFWYHSGHYERLRRLGTLHASPPSPFLLALRFGTS